MRATRCAILAASFLFTGCTTFQPNESYDPHLYDYQGRVVKPAAPAAPECREYDSVVQIGGQPQQIHGMVCRGADGAWHTVD